ncbi:MAG: nucleoside-diphosphate sugar epimerase/dehydratase [Polyangiaceae bacterium]
MDLRFDGQYHGVVEHRFAEAIPRVLAALLVCRVASFAVMKLFNGMWRYAGMPELKSILQATSLGTFAFVLWGTMLPSFRMPRSVYLGEFLASIVLVGGLRFAIRILRERQTGKVPANSVRTLIVGAGDAGESLLRDLQRYGQWTVLGFLDDDRVKQGAIIRNVKVLGPATEESLRNTIGMLDIKLVVLAMPNATGKRLRELLAICRSLKVQTKTIPGIADRLNGELNASNVRDVAIDDLLRRDPVALDVAKVESFVTNKTVLITGAGGSIGSELARQVLRFDPQEVLLFDHDENALFYIERELRAVFPAARLQMLMGDITEENRVRDVFRRFKPAVVLHAAAHKHVPMMEQNPCEAIKNNVFGTQIVADAAHEFEAEAFVLISTDKAVNPTSVMGASKRVAEMVTQLRAEGSKTRFASVRFGNVLGSAGSVVPIFQEQIARGGPVFVTHPDVCRYFMTIPEAAQLVLQAGALGGTGEIFVLDMGQPVKILDLARDLIELSGLRPDIDVAIEFTGLRPGEKLFEELLHDTETFSKTPHPKILVGKFRATTKDVLTACLGLIRKAAIGGEEAEVRGLLSQMVPEATLGQESPPLPASIRTSDKPKNEAGKPASEPTQAQATSTSISAA